MGTVSPANYAGAITLRRAILGGAAYVGQVYDFGIPVSDDTSLAVYLDSSLNPRLWRQSLRRRQRREEDPTTSAIYAVLGNRTGTVHVQQLPMVGKIVVHDQHVWVSRVSVRRDRRQRVGDRQHKHYLNLQ